MSEVANIPQLRFSEFSGEWEEKKLGELCKFTQGVQIPFSEQLTKYKEGAIRYLYIRDFFTDDFPYYVKDQYPNKVIHTDEIMMVNTGNTAGKAFMGATGVLSNNAFKVSFDKTKVSNIFLFQRITSDTIQRRIKSFFNAGGQPHLGHKNIAIIPMGFASLKEQQKIAVFLSAVDNKIEQLSKKQELLGEYKKGLMQKIFSQAIRFKADDGSEFPDWEEKKLGDLIAEISDGGTPPTSNKGNFGGGINWVVIDDIRDEIRITKETLTETGLSNSSSKLWKPETIILSTGATIGRVGIAKIYTTTKQGVCGIVVNQFTSNLFLKYWFIFNINLLKRFSQGSSIKEVRPPTLIKFDISTPSLPEQTKIANFLSSIDSKIEQVGKQLDESKQFKKALLQQMFV